GYANSIGCRTIALSGRDGGRLGPMAQLNIQASNPHMGRIEDVHMIVMHMISYYFMDAKPHVVGALLEGDGDGLIFAQALMRERRDARGTAEQNLARHPHQVAHYSHSGGSRPGAATVVERVLAVGPLHPDGIVGTAY